MSSFRAVPAMAVLGLLACAQPSPSSSPSQDAATGPVRSPGRHLLVGIALRPEGAQVVSRRVVEAPLQLDRAPARDPWRVELTDETGNVLHSGGVRPVGTIRGEFAGPDGKLQHHRVADPNAVLMVRVPMLPGVARLRVRDLSDRLDAQGKAQPGEPEVVVELPWSQVVP